MWYSKGVEGHPRHIQYTKSTKRKTSMTNEFNRDLMISMLRKGSTGTQMLNILNVIAPDKDVEAVVSAEDNEVVAV
jgi:hypothetical protein